jgi:hypothetical protein
VFNSEFSETFLALCFRSEEGKEKEERVAALGRKKWDRLGFDLRLMWGKQEGRGEWLRGRR